MKILVTGGAGFLGSHLCEKLIETDNKVICIDNLYTGAIKNIQHLMDCPNFEFIEHDIIVPIEFEADQIYNLACPASPLHYQRNPVQTGKTIVIGALNILNLAKKNNARCLQASTSEVYGNPEVHPQPEDYWGCVNPVGIRSCYDEGKRMAETFFFDYYRMYGLSIKVMRIFNTYGPRMSINDGRVVSNFIVQALENRNITLYGDGIQTRSFCYVDDLIEGMISFMNSDASFIGPCNFGNPQEFTMKQLAELICKLAGSTSGIEYMPLPKDDPVRRKPVIGLAEQKLGWRPAVELEEGLRKTIEYFSMVLSDSQKYSV